MYMLCSPKRGDGRILKATMYQVVYDVTRCVTHARSPMSRRGSAGIGGGPTHHRVRCDWCGGMVRQITHHWSGEENRATLWLTGELEVHGGEAGPERRQRPPARSILAPVGCSAHTECCHLFRLYRWRWHTGCSCCRRSGQPVACWVPAGGRGGEGRARGGKIRRRQIGVCWI